MKPTLITEHLNSNPPFARSLTSFTQYKQKLINRSNTLEKESFITEDEQDYS